MFPGDIALRQGAKDETDSNPQQHYNQQLLNSLGTKETDVTKEPVKTSNQRPPLMKYLSVE